MDIAVVSHGRGRIALDLSRPVPIPLANSRITGELAMNHSRTKSPSHDSVRNFLRITGPLFAATGLILTGVGIGSFFAAFGSFEPPRYFWCTFVGFPLIGLGMIMSKLGYLGAIYRYIAAETTPVARDAINDLGEGISPGVMSMAKAVAEGIQEGREESNHKP